MDLLEAWGSLRLLARRFGSLVSFLASGSAKAAVSSVSRF